ncbi:MAG TPA: hypothetical protein VHV57_10380 [Acidimicrobiales bacterium]|jgi:hypothetical protein|nr:hypothetical protein [Acidimicrobiales bacterium]
MVITTYQVTQESSRLSGWNSEYAETKVNDVDGSAIVEMPPMTHRRWNRHLA